MKVAKIVVLGAGVCGLASGMMLARDGHEITVLERDDGPVPESAEQAWEHWSRAGVTQFRQAHYLQPRGYAVLESALPDVAFALAAAGAVQFNSLCLMPPTVTDRAPRPGDERFITTTARRPALEQVLARAAQAEPRLETHRGVSAEGLITRPYNGAPHVTGVRIDSGGELTADLVIDAMGRRSRLPQWLSEAGGQPVQEEVEEAGFIYYTRFFRSPNGATPPPRGPLLAHVGTFSLVTLPGDNGTWSVTVFISTGDRPLKRLREPDRWTSVVAACPLQAHWLEGEPITEIIAMSGAMDRYRRLSVDGKPVATGIAPLADAWACTNPVLGRGMTLGLLHAQHLRDAVRAHLEDPHEFAEVWDQVTEAEVTPWFRETVAESRTRLREVDALRKGTEPAQPSGPGDELRAALLAAMPHDPDLFRAFLESRCCITPLRETLARPDLVQRILELARARERLPIPGPNRDRLLALLN